MKRRTAILLLGALALSAGTLVKSEARAVDHGQLGETWPVIEPDLLEVIKGRLDEAQATGQLEELNRQFAQKVERRVRRPLPVAGIGPAEATRSWEFDPAIRVENDIRDHQGNLIASAGQRVDPLATTGFSKKLVFINGDDPAEIAWALQHGSDREAKIIFTDGSPFAQMEVHQRRFYFDQGGRLTGHFGIRHTPAIVEQEGTFLRVTEQAIARAGVS